MILYVGNITPPVSLIVPSDKGSLACTIAQTHVSTWVTLHFTVSAPAIFADVGLHDSVLLEVNTRCSRPCAFSPVLALDLIALEA